MTEKYRNGTLYMAIACALGITLAQALGVGILILAALAFFLILITFSKDEYTIPLFLFFIPFSRLLKLSPSSIAFNSLALLLVFAWKCLVHSKSKYSSYIIISTAGIAVVSLFASLVNNYGIATSYVMFICMLIAFPLLLTWTKDKVSFETCVMYFSISIVLASILSLIFTDNANLQRYVISVAQEEIHDETVLMRQSGFYVDPNFYSAQVITAVGCQLLIINKKKNRIWPNVICLLALIACGISSLSKSFIFALAIVFAVWFICQFQKGVTNFIKVLILIGIVIAVVLLSGAFSDIIDLYLYRFGLAEDTTSLTSGRSDIWKQYITFLSDNPVDLLLGQGYTSVYKGVSKGSHNTLIQCVYQLGIIGFAFFAWWFAKVVGICKTKRVRASYVILLVMACFSMWIGVDELFFDDFFLNILIFSIGLKYASESADEENTI